MMLCGAAVNRFVFHTSLWTLHTGIDKKGRGDIARRRIIIINKSLLSTSSNSYERWLGSKGSRLVPDPCTRQALRYSNFQGTAVLPYLNYGKVKYSSITLDRVGHGDELVFVSKPWLLMEKLAL